SQKPASDDSNMGIYPSFNDIDDLSYKKMRFVRQDELCGADYPHNSSQGVKPSRRSSGGTYEY
ncbi:hypothetical protein, partial [Pseudomonas sp. FSL R10-0071]|uniref:hypothetical protein n=1 Tax=Pseudomonas sp. FSL R10-0071 TaxID=2662193 RepID=UPI001C49A916